jgi:pimeloyl-ACP methyl ester carboxylesterase
MTIWLQVALVLTALPFLARADSDSLLHCSGPLITCVEIKANELTFDCHLGTPDLEDDNVNPILLPVMLLHGFPEWSGMYLPLMIQLAQEGYRSLACNQRGYSPRASPPNETGTCSLSSSFFLLSSFFCLLTSSFFFFFNINNFNHIAEF